MPLLWHRPQGTYPLRIVITDDTANRLVQQRKDGHI